MNIEYKEIEEWVADLHRIADDICINWVDDLGSSMSGGLSILSAQIERNCSDYQDCKKAMFDCYEFCEEILSDPHEDDPEEKIIVKSKRR